MQIMRRLIVLATISASVACATGNSPTAETKDAFVDARAFFSKQCIVYPLEYCEPGQACPDNKESAGDAVTAVAGAVIDAGINAAVGLARYLGEAANSDPVVAIANVQMADENQSQGEEFRCLTFIHGEFSQDGKPRNVEGALARYTSKLEQLRLPLIGAPDIYLEAQIVLSKDGTAFQLLPLYAEYHRSPTRRFKRSRTRTLAYGIEMKVPAGNTLEADSFATGSLVFEDVKPGYVFDHMLMRAEPTPFMPVETSSGGNTTAIISAVETRQGSRFFAAISEILNDDVQTAINTDIRRGVVGLNESEIVSLNDLRSDALTKCFAAENAKDNWKKDADNVSLRQTWQSAHFGYVVAMRKAGGNVGIAGDDFTYNCGLIRPY